MTVTFQLLGIVIVLQTVLPVLIAPLGLILLSFLVLGYGFKRAALELRRRESVSKVRRCGLNGAEDFSRRSSSQLARCAGLRPVALT